MTDKKSRNWSTKTLAKELLIYVLAHPDLKHDTPLMALFDSLSESIVAENIGADLKTWGKKRPDPSDPQP